MSRWQLWGKFVSIPYRVRRRAYAWIERHMSNDHDFDWEEDD